MKATLRALLCLLLALCLSLPLLSCGGGHYRDDLSSASVSDTVKAALPVGDGYRVAGDSFISESDWGPDYQTLLDAITDRHILLSEKSESNVDEIGVLHVTESGDVKAVRAIVEEYVEAKVLRMTSLLESYNPAELPKLDNARITVCGNYILYTILGDSETTAAHEAFEKALAQE